MNWARLRACRRLRRQARRRIRCWRRWATIRRTSTCFAREPGSNHRVVAFPLLGRLLGRAVGQKLGVRLGQPDSRECAQREPAPHAVHLGAELPLLGYVAIRPLAQIEVEARLQKHALLGLAVAKLQRLDLLFSPSRCPHLPLHLDTISDTTIAGH